VIPVDARLRTFGQAEYDGLGSEAHRTCLDELMSVSIH